jgi:hypothetical protein
MLTKGTASVNEKEFTAHTGANTTIKTFQQ